jgi:hypothetical protein
MHIKFWFEKKQLKLSQGAVGLDDCTWLLHGAWPFQKSQYLMGKFPTSYETQVFTEPIYIFILSHLLFWVGE